MVRGQKNGGLLMIRILCVEDDATVRDYFTRRLGQEPDIEVVAAVSDVERALVYLHRQAVNVILLDLYLQGRDSTHLLRIMQPWQECLQGYSSGPAVLFCTGQADAGFAAQARLLGARGVVMKERMAKDLVPAVRAVAAGEMWFESPIEPVQASS
jgi:DNA-binding NarL/FixJ family response regulator